LTAAANVFDGLFQVSSTAGALHTAPAVLGSTDILLLLLLLLLLQTATPPTK
jgi:hypothetical protein